MLTTPDGSIATTTMWVLFVSFCRFYSHVPGGVLLQVHTIPTLPVILDSDIAYVSLLKRCAEACAGVCRTYKKLNRKVPVGFSFMALHSIFIAGLTLLYCTWAAPKELFNIGTRNGLNSCSIVLYVIAEQ